MLDAEEAATRLRAVQDPQWREAADRRVGKLRRKYRPIARALLAPTVDWRQTAAVKARADAQLAAGSDLDGLGDGPREEILSTLHPGLGPALAQYWVSAQTQPFQRGWQRKGFRATNNPALTRALRTNSVVTFVDALGPYAADGPWLAGWGGHLLISAPTMRRAGPILGQVLGAAIDRRDPAGVATRETLIEVGNGTHPTGIMGRHVIGGLLTAADPQGWDFIVRLLLSAQRQEGLRQSILEFADEAHPAAFNLLLRTVLDNKLLRFAASIRAACVWLGFRSDVTEIPLVEQRVALLANLRTDPAARRIALTSGEAWSSYIALCARAGTDVIGAMGEAEQLVTRSGPDVRAAAVRFAAASDLMSGQKLLVRELDDREVAVANLAGSLLVPSGYALPETFDAMARLVDRLPAKAQKVRPIGVEGTEQTLAASAVAGRLVGALRTRPVTDLLPWVPVMDANGRYRIATELSKLEPLPLGTRKVLLGFLSDRSSTVRTAAVKVLLKVKLQPHEAPDVERMLTRSATDVRRGALGLLATLPARDIADSVARLATSTDKSQRAGATELARSTGVNMPTPSAAPVTGLPAGRALAVRPTSTTPARRGRAPSTPADMPSGPDPDSALEDVRAALVRPQDRSVATRPTQRVRPGGLGSTAARATISALDELAAGHRNTPITSMSWQGRREILFGDIRWLPSPFQQNRPVRADDDDTDDPSGMLLAEEFRGWWAARPDSLRGDDEGRDALRAYVTSALSPRAVGTVGRPGPPNWWLAQARALTAADTTTLRMPDAVDHVALWLTAEHATAAVVDECLDALETLWALLPQSEYDLMPKDDGTFTSSMSHHMFNAPGASDWRLRRRQLPWDTVLSGLIATRSQAVTPAHIARWYCLQRWYEKPIPTAIPIPPDDGLLIRAHSIGAATDADVSFSMLHNRSRLLTTYTRRWRSQLESQHPKIVAVADTVRDRVVAAELRRGDLPTTTSRTARKVSSVTSVDLATELLAGLGKANLMRGHTRDSDSRDAVFSHLVRVSFPADGDTPATLGAAADRHTIKDARLVDLALYAPQWAPLVEGTLGWPGLADGVLWLHAHTKDYQWSVEREVRDAWAAQTAERTPLSSADLVAGAVDVDWFQRSYALLGAERWAVLHKAAKHASKAGGHTRAQMFAQAMLGEITEDTVVARITTKRHQDAVRALGLLPLPTPKAERAAATQRRYGVLQEFQRGSRQFGNQRQTSEKAAVRIGVENLARTAGYADPRRFVWAVESQEADDLADGPIVLTHGDVTVTLSISHEGVPDITVRRGDKTLASVPEALRKIADVAELRTRKTALTRQASRVRAALEDAMVAGAEFGADDFAALSRHPVVAPMLTQMLWTDSAGRTLRRADQGFTGSDGKNVTVRGDVRITHPADLVAEKSWIHWQERLFAAGCKQPFKQVFREYYPLTAAEKKAGPVSDRYAGHQLQPRQALALFNRRGWLSARDSGDTSRVFHAHNLVARVEFLDGFLTAAETDLPTIGGVYFTRRGEYLAQPLASIPPLVLSETMRDLDLVVSVAHAGGVDPETTASTTEMRAALIRETARLLKLNNITFAGDHVVITGVLGEYSLHLGSAVVHRRPGGAICIIPVGSQHRGRLFLPFADDDPKTAEVVAKTLLLASDREIKDPSILEQLRS